MQRRLGACAAHHPAAALVVLPGHCLEYATCGLIKAARHRVGRGQQEHGGSRQRSDGGLRSLHVPGRALLCVWSCRWCTHADGGWPWPVCRWCCPPASPASPLHTSCCPTRVPASTCARRYGRPGTAWRVKTGGHPGWAGLLAACWVAEPLHLQPDQPGLAWAFQTEFAWASVWAVMFLPCRLLTAADWCLLPLLPCQQVPPARQLALHPGRLCCHPPFRQPATAGAAGGGGGASAGRAADRKQRWRCSCSWRGSSSGSI